MPFPRNKMKKLLFSGVLIAFFVIAPTGCSSKSPNGSLLITCDRDETCPGGQVCSVEGYCFPVASQDVSLALEIVPVEATTKDGALLPLTRFEKGPGELDVDTEGKVKVVYSEPAEVSITVDIDPTGTLGFPDTSLFNAKVGVTRDSRIPGRPRVLLTGDLSQDIESPDPSVPLLFFVPTQAIYTVRVSPLDLFAEAFPTQVKRDLPVLGDTDINFTFGDENQFIWVTGRITDALDQGIPNVQIHLVDEEGTYTSTLSSPTIEDGWFELVAPQGEREYVLVVRSSDPGRPLPELRFDVHILGAAEYPFENIGIYSYPALPNACSYSFQVLGNSSSGVKTEVAGAIINFSAVVGGGSKDDGLFSAKAVSDSGGSVDVQLLPGVNLESRTYNLQVIPPLDSEFGAMTTQLDVASCGGMGQVIELDPRIVVHGVVRSSNQGPVANVTVTANVSSKANNSYSLAALMLQEGLISSEVTNSKGEFLLLLDPGLYDFELSPGAATMLPRWLVTGIQVGEGGVDSISLNLGIPNTGLLRGMLVDESENPLTGFVVKAYRVPAECLPDRSDVECTQSAFFLGESAVQNDGTFQMVVPNP